MRQILNKRTIPAALVAGVCLLVVAAGLLGGTGEQPVSTTDTTAIDASSTSSIPLVATTLPAPTIPPPEVTPPPGEDLPVTTPNAEEPSTTEPPVITIPAPVTDPPATMPAPATTQPPPATPPTTRPQPIDWRAIVPTPPPGGRGTLDSQTADEYRAHFDWENRPHAELIDPLVEAFEAKGWTVTRDANSSALQVSRPGVTGRVTISAGAAGAGSAHVVYDLHRS